MRAKFLSLFLCAFLLAGCSGVQSALAPEGPAANELAWLIWFFTGLSAAIWLLVMAGLAASIFRARSGGLDPLAIDEPVERQASRTVTASVAATAAVLVALTLLSFFSNRTLAGIGSDSALTIQVTGHQWWWEVRYEGAEPSRILDTANEIHIPSGEPVRILLASEDVIHSFWVPALHGKLDLIPGVVNTLTLQADKPGTYRGQCAEFCGAQHAHMAMVVIAQPRAEFDAWYRDQLRPAAGPRTVEQRAGQELFMERPASCATESRAQRQGHSRRPI